MLYAVNLEQDVCVGSCLHLHNLLFMAERSRKVGNGWRGRWVLLSPNWCAKISLYFWKIQCSWSVGCFQYSYIVRQLSTALHAQVTTIWNGSVDVALEVGSTLVSEEVFGLCFSRAELLCPVCGLLPSLRKEILSTALSAAVSWGCQNEILNAVYYICWHRQSIWQYMWGKTQT